MKTVAEHVVGDAVLFGLYTPISGSSVGNKFQEALKAIQDDALANAPDILAKGVERYLKAVARTIRPWEKSSAAEVADLLEKQAETAHLFIWNDLKIIEQQLEQEKLCPTKPQ